jgi:hypothetical protein
MDGTEFRSTLQRIGFTQAAFARQLDLPPRTIQRWAKNGPPKHVAYLISAMAGHFLPHPHDGVWVARDGGVVEAAGAFELSLQSWLQRAVHAGWPRDVAAAGAIACFARILLEMRSPSSTRS